MTHPCLCSFEKHFFFFFVRVAFGRGEGWGGGGSCQEEKARKKKKGGLGSPSWHSSSHNTTASQLRLSPCGRLRVGVSVWLLAGLSSRRLLFILFETGSEMSPRMRETVMSSASCRKHHLSDKLCVVIKAPSEEIPTTVRSPCFP